MLLLIVTIVFTSLYFGFLFKHRKNPEKGGKIALCKKFWLFYTLYSWFIFLPIALYSGYVSESFYWSFILLTSSMWARAFVELYMMYISKNWTPPIGITHDILTLLLFLIPLFYAKDFSLNIETLFAMSLGLSLILETYYAIAFYKIVQEKTKGDNAVWFANKEDPAFATVLLVTTLFNVPLFGILFLIFLKYLPEKLSFL